MNILYGSVKAEPVHAGSENGKILAEEESRVSMDNLNDILTYPGMYEFLTGPLFVISVVFSAGGFVFQVRRFFKATVRVKRLESKRTRNLRDLLGTLKNPAPFLRILKNTLWVHRPFMAISTTVFHVLVIVTPVFLLAHNILLREAAGFCLPFFSEKVTDWFTWIILLSGLMFLARRVFFRNVRAVTTKSDFILLALVLFPYLSGFLLYHQLCNFNRLLMLLHVAGGELMLVCLPFTKLVHFLYFFFNRFLITTEHGIMKGTREWKEIDDGYVSVRAGG